MKHNRLPAPELTVRSIIGLNCIIYVLSLILSGKGMSFSMNPFSALAPSNGTLIFLGGTGTIPIDRFGEWWSLISASWLHGSLIHLLFNMTALLQIAPLIISEYGLHRMIIIYTLSGVSGFYLSYLAGVQLTIGASAAICGLIGSALYYGKSRGGYFGQMVYKQTSGWVFGLVLFGLFIPGINNWGHGGGLAAGIGVGYLLGYNERAGENALHRAGSAVCIIATIGILLWALGSAIYLKF